MIKIIFKIFLKWHKTVFRKKGWKYHNKTLKLYMANKTQNMTHIWNITRWSIPKSDWLYSLQPKMEKLHTVSKNKTGSWLWLRLWTPSYWKFKLKLKKVGKTTRPFRYDLNQIPYGYTVEVTNRSKGLDLIECLKTTQGCSWHCTGGSD